MKTEVVFAELLSVIGQQEKRELILLFNNRDEIALKLTLIKYLRKYKRQLRHLF
ncbi:MAG: hypothetical protein ACEPO8_09760 [Rhodothermaceae bacterium]